MAVGSAGFELRSSNRAIYQRTTLPETDTKPAVS